MGTVTLVYESKPQGALSARVVKEQVSGHRSTPRQVKRSFIYAVSRCTYDKQVKYDRHDVTRHDRQDKTRQTRRQAG